MGKTDKSFEEIEKILQDVGQKIEHLIEKGAEASAELRDEIEVKIQELKVKRDTLEKEFEERKAYFKEKYQDKRE